MLPEEWRRLIEREDGSRRKVVLYNTTLGAMLRDTEEMLAKIRNVFEVFRNQKEVVLLWRPHPLLRETLCSMRSRTVLEYDDSKSWSGIGRRHGAFMMTQRICIRQLRYRMHIMGTTAAW